MTMENSRADLTVELHADQSVEENAARYYEAAKKLKRKRAGLLEAIEETKKKIKSRENTLHYAAVREAAKPVKKIVSRNRQWFEKFKHFTTSQGQVCIAGSDAKQNELLVSKHLEKTDLFFHADVHGAAAVILKEGQSASEQSKKEAAQFAACFSSAWKARYSVADVFYAKPEQVSKYAQGEYVAKGGFMIYGKKQYFRSLPLKLLMVKSGEGEAAFPALYPECFDFESNPVTGSKVALAPGSVSKSDAAKKVVKKLGLENAYNAVDEVLRLLPGDCDL